jgi:type IV pilus assembly protein PilW
LIAVAATDRCSTLPARNCAAGFTLVEMMVAVVIGLLIIAGMFTAFLSTSWTTGANARFSEVQNNGRGGIDFMRREVRHAGFYGNYFWFGTDEDINHALKNGATGTADYGCGAGFVTRIEEPIWGQNDSRSDLASCIAEADYARGDVLVVRRAGLLPATPSTGNLYVRTEFARRMVFAGAAPAAPVPPPINATPTPEDYPLEVQVYYVSPYSSTVGDGVPALKRKVLSGTSLVTQVVATGIENMQIQYGVYDAPTGATSYVDASSGLDWRKVIALRIWLLARSTEAEPGYRNTDSYTIGDQTVTASDGYVRQVFPLVVGARR